jgi:alpha-L-fucosidase
MKKINMRLTNIILVATGLITCITTLEGASVSNNPLAVTANTARAEALARWQKAKFGLFLHWGVYSVYGGTYRGKELWSCAWIQENARIPYEEYAKTAAVWNPKDFDADAWVRTAKDAGMRYIVITAKHHDGFAIYPSKASSYNLFTSGAYKGPDPLAELKKACAKYGMLFGIYYSVLEFRGSPKGFDEEDEKAVAAGFDYRTLGPKPYATAEQIAALAKAQIRELAEWYKPDIFWFDGTWDQMGKWTEADANETEKMIRSIIPNVIINDRLGVKNPDFVTYENKIPDSPPGGMWEYCWNLGVFWGYNPRNYTPDLLKTPEHYIETLARIASLGGNYLLNAGPDPTGKFLPMAIDYLHKIGKWVNPNREAIEGVLPSPFPKKPDWGYVTCREGKVYLIIRASAASAPVAIPALKNRLLGAYLLTSPETKVVVTCGEQEWRIGPVGEKTTPPFVVVVLSVDGMPEASK